MAFPFGLDPSFFLLFFERFCFCSGGGCLLLGASVRGGLASGGIFGGAFGLRLFGGCLLLGASLFGSRDGCGASFLGGLALGGLFSAASSASLFGSFSSSRSFGGPLSASLFGGFLFCRASFLGSLAFGGPLGVALGAYLFSRGFLGRTLGGFFGSAFRLQPSGGLPLPSLLPCSSLPGALFFLSSGGFVLGLFLFDSLPGACFLCG